MPIISHTDRRSPRGRLVVTAIYLALVLGGITMVYPFGVMLTGSLSTPFDYERRNLLPRCLWSREDRFLRALCGYFPPSHRLSLRQVRAYYPDFPETWQAWMQVGDDTAAADAWAGSQLARLEDPAQRSNLQAAARDYAEFMRDWNLRETILAYDNRFVAPFLRGRYRSLDALNRAWELSIDDFAKVDAAEWSGEPIDQATYVPITDNRYRDLLEYRDAYRRNRYSPHLAGEGAPAGFLRPAALRFVWEDFAAAARPASTPTALAALPFPVGPDAPADLQTLWTRFLREGFPLRHVAIRADADRQAAFRTFLTDRFRNVDYLNRVLGGGPDPSWRAVASWDEILLTPTVPDGPLAKVWMDFVLTAVPTAEWTIRDTLPEAAFQAFARSRYGSLEKLNTAYGTRLAAWEQLRIPFGEAILVTFANREWPILGYQFSSGYKAVFEYLFHRGRAVRNTLILVVLAMLISVTVNPLAGYALSRFKLRQTEKVVLFCLATMAFPAAVAAIPGFLLLRDLGLLNTFAALVLPSAANGMTIFLLKGFFDALPRELYEAATIDGAPEWRIFVNISLPLVKPILAVSLLGAFISAYNGWEWAIIVCQDQRMWTVAVWTYQFHQTLGSQPYTVMAAFIVNSIPVLLVFLFCQNIILRGIVLPQMK